MRSIVVVALLAIAVAADDFPQSRVVVANFLSDQFTDSIVTAGLTSLAQSVIQKLSYQDGLEDFKDAVMDKLMSQSKFIGPFLKLSGDVSDLSGLIDKVVNGLGKSLKPVFKQIKNKNIKTNTAFDKLFKKLATKKFFKKAYANVKTSLSPQEWKSCVNDLYDVIQFKAFGIQKVA